MNIKGREFGHEVRKETRDKLRRFFKKDGCIDIHGYKIHKIFGKSVKEHHLVWCNQPSNLPYIPKGFHIHHINQNKLDNRIENLFLMSCSDHMKFNRFVDKIMGLGIYNRWKNRVDKQNEK